MTPNWMAHKVEPWPTTKLIPYARNARTHSDEQVAQIAASIVEFGFRDVSTPPKARLAGLNDYPGFDLLFKLSHQERAIEVKGRVGVGEIELTENEWARACILRERYWLYAVFECGGSQPRLFRVQDPLHPQALSAGHARYQRTAQIGSGER